MPSVCILNPGASVRLTGERLSVSVPAMDDDPAVHRDIPLREIERVIHAEQVQVSGAALGALMRASIPVSVLGWEGRFLGSYLPPLTTQVEARLRQYRRTLEPDFARQVASALVSAKLYNQRRVLQRLGASRRAGRSDPESSDGVDGELTATLRWLESEFASIRVARTVDEIRGHEGVTAARYFAAWSGFLPEAFPFERRSTRPPLNPVNACISFGATIVYTEMVAFLHAHGLDPALGCLHAPTDGRWSLALDLIEPFRPALVEALALDLFSHQILNGDHFERRDGGVFLNDGGRRKFFLQYERRMERQFLSEAVGHRTSLRSQLERQALLYKTALERPEEFEPFVMN